MSGIPGSLVYTSRKKPLKVSRACVQSRALTAHEVARSHGQVSLWLFRRPFLSLEIVFMVIPQSSVKVFAQPTLLLSDLSEKKKNNVHSTRSEQV